MPHDGLRFGVIMEVSDDRDAWVTKCQRAEADGFDVVSVADHVGLPPCFPALVLAAENTERVRLGTLVLNAAFYAPGLLAREAAGTDRFTGGRLELGLGAGYNKAEFDLPGARWMPAGERVDHLERTVVELDRYYGDPRFHPRPARPEGPPLLIGGRGNRVLTLAARHADIIGFNGAAPVADGEIPTIEDAAAIAERVAFVRERLGERADQVEFNLLLSWVERTEDPGPSLDRFRQLMPHLTREQVADNPTVLVGTLPQMADRLRQLTDQHGFT